MLKFSGDKDGVVPTPGTINWINHWLDEANSTIAPEQEAWAPYTATNQYNEEKHVAGYHWKLNGMTFATVHGAGHMVPTDQPQVAQQIMYNFIHDQVFSTPWPLIVTAPSAEAVQEKESFI